MQAKKNKILALCLVGLFLQACAAKPLSREEIKAFRQCFAETQHEFFLAKKRAYKQQIAKICAQELGYSQERISKTDPGKVLRGEE